MKVKPLKGDTNLLVIFSFALSKLSACEGKVTKGANGNEASTRVRVTCRATGPGYL